MRHKTNWERVMAAIDSIRGNKEAVEILRRELGPKYAAVVAKRERIRRVVDAYRQTEEGRRKRKEYAEKYNAYLKSKRERERAARIENETKEENQK